MPPDVSRLLLRGLGYRYGFGRWVLRDLDASWTFASVVAVTGSNGSGKSTLLRLVAGVARPRAGSVLHRPARSAYVPERLAPPPGTVGGWRAGMAGLRGVPRPSADRWLDLLGLVVDDTDALGALSKGMFRKLLLAEALAAPVRLLVLDEPWADLDAAGAEALAQALRERASHGALVVVADHTGIGSSIADDRVALDGTGTTVDVRYRGDAGRLAALDAAAERLGFRRVGE